jgi:hypothetical protein
LWELVRAGRITSDTFQPVRSLVHEKEDWHARRELREGPPGSPEFLRTLRGAPIMEARTGPLVAGAAARDGRAVTPTGVEREHGAATAGAQRNRDARDGARRERAGWYPVIHPALRKMAESGWIRRGMFVAGLGAAQFAMTSAVDMLRTLRTDPERAEAIHIAASDPANPYGTVLAWPREEDGEAHGIPHSMSRSSGASVILVNGRLAAFLRRRNPEIRVLLPENEPERSHAAREGAKLAASRSGGRSQTGPLIGEIDGLAARRHFLAWLWKTRDGRHGGRVSMRRVALVVEMEFGGDDDGEECPKATRSGARRERCSAIGGRVVTRFETVLVKLARVNEDTPLAGRVVEGGVRRQVAGDALLGRLDSAHPHADEREPAIYRPRAVEVVAVRHAIRSRLPSGCGGVHKAGLEFRHGAPGAREGWTLGPKVPTKSLTRNR